MIRFENGSDHQLEPAKRACRLPFYPFTDPSVKPLIKKR